MGTGNWQDSMDAFLQTDELIVGDGDQIRFRDEAEELLRTPVTVESENENED